MINRKEIKFSFNRNNQKSHIILNKNGNNSFLVAIGDLIGIYVIYFENSIIYIGKATKNISDRISVHFRIGNGNVHIQKFVTNTKKITKIKHNEFYDLMVKKGKVIIYYLDLTNNKRSKKIEKEISKFESFCINYENPPCNTQKKSIEFPTEWFKLFIRND